MNRQNLFKHLMLAFAIILVAAFAGQIRRARLNVMHAPAPPAASATDDDADDDANAAATDFEPSGDAEVIVRFRAGTSSEEINRIAARLHDRVEDRFEYVDDEA